MAFVMLTWASAAFGQNIPIGYTVPPDTLSADKKYGVLVPNSDDEDTIKNPQNQIVEVKTGHVLGAIHVDPDYVAFDHVNNGAIAPAEWAPDNSMLLWQVDGKWGFETEILIKIENGKIKSQIDVLNLLEQEMLKRTCQASPKKYAAVKATSADYGSWYKDGFAIDCVLDNPNRVLKFPLLYHCFLTSNTKDMPDMTNLDSRMTAEVEADGTIKVRDFHLGTNPPARNW